MIRTGGTFTAAVLWASCVPAQEAGFGPAPADLPQAVDMMRPTSIPRKDMLVRDGCFYYRDRHGDIRPFDFASSERGVPFCEGDPESVIEAIPLPRSQ
ncbi:hypothetical protein [Jannaschia pohangensis]|uniref:hypothetical protein n=1 Tax=Jannaschia pohangensis TaxID=390807 RepID=UPI000B897180|nr:hypothetical protein [Jannaschia pohangensis]